LPRPLLGSPYVYVDSWNRLCAGTQAAAGQAKDLQGRPFRQANPAPHDVPLADGVSGVRVWFSPNTPQKTKTAHSEAPPDLEQVFDLIQDARHAVLFLACQPGSPSIINAVADAQAANDFRTQLYHLPGKKPGATVVPAKAITDQFSFREHELLKDPAGQAIIHDKIAVIDPVTVPESRVTNIPSDTERCRCFPATSVDQSDARNAENRITLGVADRRTSDRAGMRPRRASAGGTSTSEAPRANGARSFPPLPSHLVAAQRFHTFGGQAHGRKKIRIPLGARASILALSCEGRSRVAVDQPQAKKRAKKEGQRE
jgi:hypothetical protein